MRLFDNLGELIDEDTTKLVVVEAKAPSKKANILCIGDSLTCAGYWSFEGFRRFALDGGTPEGLGFKDSLNLIGTVKKKVGEDEIGHEGYGSWQWRTTTPLQASSSHARTSSSFLREQTMLRQRRVHTSLQVQTRTLM